jgi:uroporphyrinogen decarboxylase
MTPLERVMAVFRHEEPDRVPIFELLIDAQIVTAILPGGTYADLVEALDIDCAVTSTPSDMYNLRLVRHDGSTPVYQSEWGETRAGTGEAVTIPVGHPIHSHSDWDSYQVPDPDRPGRLAALEVLIGRFKGTRAVGCHLHDSFSYPSYLFGMSELFMALLDEPQWTREVIAACNAHCVRMVELAVRMGADFVVFGDDVGGKSGPLMSPRLYEEFFLPGLAAVTQRAHELGARVIKHTDGNVYSLLDMFIDAGVDAFHPSDPSAGMDIVEVKRRYGDKLALCGGISTGAPLCEWPVPQLVAEVRGRIEALAPGGGWMISSNNTIHSGVLPENYQALVKAVHQYGWYGRLNESIGDM